MPQDLMAALEQHAAPFASALIWIKAIRICVCHAALVNRALVVGGTGDLGRAVTRSLREQGWEVRIFSRRPSPDLQREGYQHSTGDILDAAALRKAISDC
jgi:phosphoglycerate dehydrogenase-like enzyme